MKTVSRVALGMALALGAVSVVATPAVAQKKEKKDEAKAWSPKLGKEFRKPAEAVQKAVAAGDVAGATAALAQAEAAAQSPDEKYFVGSLRLSIAQLTKDDAQQRKAVEEMLASGGGPVDSRGQLNFYAGNFAYNAKEYPRALQFLSEAKRLGYVHTDAANQPTRDLDLLLTETYFKTNQAPQGLAIVEQLVKEEQAAGRKAPEEWYKRAVSAAYQAKNDAELAKWMRLQLEAYPTAENWRSALVIYQQGANLDNPANLDLLRLMRASKALTSEREYFEYAELAQRGGLVGEAKAVIDEGRAAGVFDASNRAISDIYTAVNGQVKSDRASLPAAEKSAAAAANGRAAMGTADAYLGYGDYAKAAEMYKLALQKGGVDANMVNTRLGIALARSGQKDAAKAAFDAVTGPRAELARFWVLWMNQQA